MYGGLSDSSLKTDKANTSDLGHIRAAYRIDKRSSEKKEMSAKGNKHHVREGVLYSNGGHKTAAKLCFMKLKLS